MGYHGVMKTTLEMPDSLFKRARATAMRRGQTMTSFFNSAVEAKLNADADAGRDKPWMAFAGILSGRREEARRIMKTIDDACERIDAKDWT
jgi:hypothetical protein